MCLIKYKDIFVYVQFLLFQNAPDQDTELVEAAVNAEADNTEAADTADHADQELADNSFDVTAEINEDAPVVERYL